MFGAINDCEFIKKSLVILHKLKRFNGFIRSGQCHLP